MQVLPERLKEPGYSGLRSYLADDFYSLKLLQLSQKIAGLFDQYLIFRPQMIFYWEQAQTQDTPDQRWQADLWRKIIAGKEERKHGSRCKLIRIAGPYIPRV